MRLVSSLTVAVLLSLAACRGGPTAPGERIRELEVASSTVSCTGLYERQCLQARDVGTTEWLRWYDPIEGFTWEAGYQYRLRVAEREVANPPADGSSAAYRLLAVLSQVRE